jgi:hypothetical protein
VSSDTSVNSAYPTAGRDVMATCVSRQLSRTFDSDFRAGAIIDRCGGVAGAQCVIGHQSTVIDFMTCSIAEET